MARRTKFKYRCKKCGLVTEHKRLKVYQAVCPTCKRITMQMLLGPVKPAAPTEATEGAISLPAVTPGKSTTVAVEHVPILDLTPSEATMEAPGEGEPEVTLEAVDVEAWSAIYGLPSEAVSVALGAPELRFSDETCRRQGVRIARFCQRHGITLPPYVDALPIIGRALQDYGMILRAAAVRMKSGRQKGEAAKTEPAAPGEETSGVAGITMPESTVEHVSSEAPGDIDERIKRAVMERR